MTHACAVVDYFEDVIGLTRDDEISEEFAFLWTGDYRGGVAAQTPGENTVRLTLWEGIVILSRGVLRRRICCLPPPLALSR